MNLKEQAENFYLDLLKIYMFLKGWGPKYLFLGS